jgi:hypothetical protein
MLAGVYNIRCDQGSTFQRVITVTQPSATAGVQEPVDLTSYTARMQVRKTFGGVELIELTSGDGITLGGVDGTITIDMTAAQTSDITRSGVYDLELVTGDTVLKVLRGQFILTPEVTV